MEDIRIEKSKYLNIFESELTHFISTVTSVDTMPDMRVRIRMEICEPYNNRNLFLVNNDVIECFLPPINSNKVIPYQKMLRWIGDSLPIYEDNSFHLVDLTGATVIASVQPRYVRKMNRYDTKLINLIIVLLDEKFSY